MAENQQIKFTELLCSKLCHDLISPISAINNGFEFFNEENFNEKKLLPFFHLQCVVKDI